jgi:hypothetical protein
LHGFASAAGKVTVEMPDNLWPRGSDWIVHIMARIDGELRVLGDYFHVIVPITPLSSEEYVLDESSNDQVSDLVVHCLAGYALTRINAPSG